MFFHGFICKEEKDYEKTPAFMGEIYKISQPTHTLLPLGHFRCAG